MMTLKHMSIMIIIILVFLYLLMSLFGGNKNEPYETLNADKSIINNKNDSDKSIINNKNSEKNIKDVKDVEKRDNSTVFRASDPFQSAIPYDNTLVDNEVSELGIDKCLAKCKGCCVEFGYTGSAYCFEGDCP